MALNTAKASAIREPQQARSRETMDRILDALEVLMAEKPFERITMQELAERSGCGTSSIYARFRDKHALILAMHARLRERTFACLDTLADPTRWSGTPIDQIVADVMPTVVHFYRLHGPLIRAALLVDEEEVRERQASVLRAAATSFSALIPTTSPRQARAVAGAVDAATRIVSSVMYSALLFGPVEVSRSKVTDRELARQLVCATTALLKQALDDRNDDS